MDRTPQQNINLANGKLNKFILCDDWKTCTKVGQKENTPDEAAHVNLLTMNYYDNLINSVRQSGCPVPTIPL